MSVTTQMTLPSYESHRLKFGALLVTTLSLSIWIGLSIGAIGNDYSLPFTLLWSVFDIDLGLSGIENIIANIRAPRVVMALLVGAALAVSGASLQGVCRNPLADPGLLGISSGAAVGAVAMIFMTQPLLTHYPQLQSLAPFLISIAAVIGAGLTAFAVYFLAQTNGQLQIPTLLLAGVALNSLGVAIIGGFNFMADDQALRLITFWLMGSMGGATWTSVAILLPIIGIAIFRVFQHRHAINLLLLGEANARFSGVDVDRVKFELIWLNALIVGVAVAFSGIIGFVGLVVPHILRLHSDTNYRYLILNSALLGGSLLVIADLISRVAIAPAELPIGILTSLIGAPFFIVLLLKQKRSLGFAL